MGVRTRTSFRGGDKLEDNPWDRVQVGEDGNLIGYLDENGKLVDTLDNSLLKKSSMAGGDTGRRKSFPQQYIPPRTSPRKKYR